MKQLFLAIICVLAIATITSCNKDRGQRTGAILKVESIIPQGVGSVLVTATIAIDDTVVVVPCQLPPTQVRLLAADQKGILSSCTAYVWFEDGKYVHIEHVAFNSTRDYSDE